MLRAILFFVSLCVLCVQSLVLIGCDTRTADGREIVTVAGTQFKLDGALDHATRTKGLGGRTEIPADGGMIFVFPIVSVLEFVMRDCPVPIDVAFLDDSGRVLTIHEMTPEDPQRAGESPEIYEQRLKRYSSRYPARYAVELAGGTYRKLGVKPGDLIEFDREGLKKRLK